MKITYFAAFMISLFLSACTQSAPKGDADAIVVGAGIAGLSAAVELARGGAKVIVIDMNSVGGGHAVMAGGVALVGTPLQKARGINDTPDQAFADWMAWGETNDPEWTRLYAEKSRTEVYDWVTAMGVEFVMLIPTPENSVARFHFTKGKAAHLVLPIFRQALENPNISFIWNTQADRLRIADGAVIGLSMTNLRTGEHHDLTSSGVILATGGFQGNLDMVRANWSADAAFPDQLLIGGSNFATGAGFEMAKKAGATFDRLNTQVTFIGGVPNPRRPGRALVAANRQAIWVNDAGARFTNEAASDKVNTPRILALNPAHYWMIFDQSGSESFSLRDALWLTPETISTEIINNPEITTKAATLQDLSAGTGLPLQNLVQTVSRYNALVKKGVDEDFARFTQKSRRKPSTIITPPFYAIKLYPLTRKNLGGVAIDFSGRALDKNRHPIKGFYAAGELTGLAGINGDHGMAGTFLGPSILTGRLAAKGFLADFSATLLPAKPQSNNAPTQAPALSGGVKDLPGLLQKARPGYWHFETSHRLVLERNLPCATCHAQGNPKAPAQTSAAMLMRTQTCLTCH